MVRPRKDIDQLRFHKITVAFSNVEKQYAIEQAQIIGNTLSEWVRKSALAKLSLPARVSKMQLEYYKQLVGVSNNLNQLTRKVNAGQYTKIHSDLQEMKSLLSKIHSVL